MNTPENNLTYPGSDAPAAVPGRDLVTIARDLIEYRQKRGCAAEVIVRMALKIGYDSGAKYAHQAATIPSVEYVSEYHAWRFRFGTVEFFITAEQAEKLTLPVFIEQFLGPALTKAVEAQV